MNLQQRIELLAKLGNYIISNNEEWQSAKERAALENAWFTPEIIDLATKNIAQYFLQEQQLKQWTSHYSLQDKSIPVRTVGIVMAGNIPLVGFHDFLCTFICGHIQVIKLSSKDNILLKFLVNKMTEWAPELADVVSFAERLNNCDAYIATGSNNSGRYFEYYFQKYPHIIRRNRTSVAILEGNEPPETLQLLGKDMMQYFGLGCRNVTKIFVPENYDFVPLLQTLKPYNIYLDHHKYKHNYDYQLALALMNNKFYMNSGAIVFSENESLFSPISVVHYSYYTDKELPKGTLQKNDDVQCIVGVGSLPFGVTQQPSLSDYADGIDTIHFLSSLE